MEKISKWKLLKCCCSYNNKLLENCESQVSKCLQRIKKLAKNAQNSSRTLALPRTLTLVQSGCSYLSFTQPPCLLLYWYQNLLLISYFFRFLALFLLYPLSSSSSFSQFFLSFFLSVRSSFSLTSFRFHYLSGVIPLAPLLPDFSFTLHFVTHFFPLPSVNFPCLVLIGAYGEYGANRMAPWVFFPLQEKEKTS